MRMRGCWVALPSAGLVMWTCGLGPEGGGAGAKVMRTLSWLSPNALAALTVMVLLPLASCRSALSCWPLKLKSLILRPLSSSWMSRLCSTWRMLAVMRMRGCWVALPSAGLVICTCGLGPEGGGGGGGWWLRSLSTMVTLSLSVPAGLAAVMRRLLGPLRRLT